MDIMVTFLRSFQCNDNNKLYFLIHLIQYLKKMFNAIVFLFFANTKIIVL